MTVTPAAAAIAVAYFFWRRRRTPTGYGTILTDALGRVPGRAVLLLYTLWLLFYAGFLLRSGAERFISTVYPGAAAWVFIAVMTATGAAAALGKLKTIARAAMIFRPLLIAVLAFSLLLTVKDLDPALLAPVTAADLVPNGCAALQAANVLSVAAYTAFLGDRLDGRLRVRDFAPWLVLMVVIIGAMAACCIGLFGAELTAKLSYPFFMLVRDVTVLGSLERVEPVVIALWVFSDFIFISLLLFIAGKNLRECFGCSAQSGGAVLANGRWFCLLCAAAAAATGLLIGQDAQSFALYSETVVPLVNAVMVFALPVPVLIVGLLRKKI